jgi:hypothetical protein
MPKRNTEGSDLAAKWLYGPKEFLPCVDRAEARIVLGSVAAMHSALMSGGVVHRRALWLVLRHALEEVRIATYAPVPGGGQLSPFDERQPGQLDQVGSGA